MIPIKYKECNFIAAESQDEYLTLHAHRDETGCVTSCWLMTIRERFKLLFTGKVYLSLLTFNQPIQPQLLSATNPIGTDEES